jgi:hypothetical protein
MKKHTHRKPATLVLTGLLVIGGTVAAQPAFAYSGTITKCVGSALVVAKGTKNTTGPMVLKAVNNTRELKQADKGTFTQVGSHSAGNWSVTGTGATAGSGYCG